MSKRTRKPAPKPDPYPMVIETYSVPWGLDQNHHLRGPSCFNGIVEVQRYRITIERIEEPLDVIRDRLVTLWRTKEPNWHHSDPMRAAASRLLGITRAEADELLKSEDHGCEFKVRNGGAQ